MLSHVPANFSTIVVTCILHNHYEQVDSFEILSVGGFVSCSVGIVKKLYNFYCMKMFWVRISQAVEKNHRTNITCTRHEKWEKRNKTCSM